MADTGRTRAVNVSLPDDAHPASGSAVRGGGLKVACDVNFVCWSAAWGWDNPVNTNQKMAWSVARQRSRQGKREWMFRAGFQVWGGTGRDRAEQRAGSGAGRGAGGGADPTDFSLE